jgi:hypothetical protein
LIKKCKWSCSETSVSEQLPPKKSKICETCETTNRVIEQVQIWYFRENIMNDIIIKKLSPELVDDYLYFFDNIGFSDHKEWSWCYCTFYHFDDETGKKPDHTAKTSL